MPRRRQEAPTKLGSSPKKQSESERVVNKEEEKKRIITEHKKEQESQERKKQDALERVRRDEEAKKNREELLAKKKLEEERLKREAEEKRKLEEEDNKRIRDEEERKKRVELELKKKMDDDRRKAEERKKKAEEERKKRQEEEAKRLEERRRKQEEETRRLEEENAELLLKAANNDFSFLTSSANRNTLPEPEVDLLGGGSDDDEFYSKRKHKHSKKKGDNNNNYIEGLEDGIDNYQVSSSESDKNKTHRLAPQRGRIDEITDNELDRISYSVPIKKQGRNDGVYMLGQKMMKVNQHLQVTVGRNMMSVREFIEKFERVESIRQKGLESAVLLSRFMANGISI